MLELERCLEIKIILIAEGLLRSEVKSLTAPQWAQYLASKRWGKRRRRSIRLMRSSSSVLWEYIRLAELISEQLKIHFTISHSLMWEQGLRGYFQMFCDRVILWSFICLYINFSLGFSFRWTKHSQSWSTFFWGRRCLLSVYSTSTYKIKLNHQGWPIFGGELRSSIPLGQTCLSSMNGMFVLCIYDPNLYPVRDHVTEYVKPSGANSWFDLPPVSLMAALAASRDTKTR